MGKSDYAPNLQLYSLRRALNCDEANVKLVLRAELSTFQILREAIPTALSRGDSDYSKLKPAHSARARINGRIVLNRMQRIFSLAGAADRTLDRLLAWGAR